jgi:hypothetical protein
VPIVVLRVLLRDKSGYRNTTSLPGLSPVGWKPGSFTHRRLQTS